MVYLKNLMCKEILNKFLKNNSKMDSLEYSINMYPYDVTERSHSFLLSRPFATEKD